MAERPEYNAKIKLMSALAPVAYMEHMKSPLTVLAPIANQLEVKYKIPIRFRSMLTVRVLDNL
jgi:hypothetical protein